MRGQIISEAPEVGAWTWTLDEMTEIEKLVCAETPTAREEIGTTMTALRKPLKMWPGLYHSRPNQETTRPGCTIRFGGGAERSLGTGKEIRSQRVLTIHRQQV